MSGSSRFPFSPGGYHNMLLLILLFLSSSWTQASSASEPERHKVIVVGAGIAGLTAAATLLEHNVTDVQILEASDRIGGRTHTVKFGDVDIDKGAEFVHGQGKNEVYKLIKPYDLLVSYATVSQSEQILFVNSSGHIYDSITANNLFEEGTKILYEEGEKFENGPTFDNFNKRYVEFVKARNVSVLLGEGVRHAVLLEEGVHSGMGDIQLLGHSEFTDYWECEGDVYLKWKTGGYKTIYDFITKKFPNASEELPVVNKTVLGKQVTRVERREGDVEVTCADGSTYVADHVIVTVSLGVLKKHAATMFQPALPANNMAAIEALGIGCVGKVFLLFPNRWWPKDKHIILPLFSDEEKKQYIINSKFGNWVVNTSSFSPVLSHERMLCAWFSGEACHAIESLYEQEVVDGMVELLEKLAGDKYNVTRPEAVLRTGWWSNPYTLGAYSYRTPDSDAANITGSHLALPVVHNNKPVVLFAGEATHEHYYSTVHGALESGRREAHRIIDYLKDNPKF